MEIEVCSKSVKDLRNEKYFDDVVEEFVGYEDGYICDVIQEIADNNVTIYTSDLWDWASEHQDYVEQAVSEFGADGRDFDLIRLFQQGQYLYNSEVMYEHFDEILLYYAYNYICEELGIEEIEENTKEELEETLKGVDNNDKIEDIIEKIKEVIGDEE